MAFSTEQQFYLDLYWDQRRIAQERLFRSFNRWLFAITLVMIAAVPLFARWGITNGVDLSTSSIFQAILVGGALVWSVLLLHLIRPYLFFSLAGRILLRKKHDSLCREIALGKDVKYRDLLVANKALRHKKDSLGKTPLFYLCRTNQFDLVREFIGKDRSLINRKDSLGETPFLEALRSGHSQIVKWMLEQGPQFRNGFTPFMALAATADSKQLYQNLLANGLTDEAANDGTTALLIAARARQFANVEVLLEKFGSCSADKYASHPMDWVLAAQASAALQKMVRLLSQNPADADFLDRANNSFLHKAVLTHFPAATQLLFQSFPKSADIRNSDRKTPEDIALSESQSDPSYSRHLAILQKQPQAATATSPASSSPTTSHNAFSAVSVDFDEIAASLEMAMSGLDRGKNFADDFAADLQHFFESKHSQIQIWIGGSGRDKTDRALKAREVLAADRYAGVFFPHFLRGHEHIDRLIGLFDDFANPSLYPDHSVIFIEDAEMFLDPSENTIDPKTHNILLKKINTLHSSRKLSFVFIGSFKTRKRPFTAVEKNEIFGEDVAALVMERIFYPPEIYAFMNSVLPEYEAQDIQLDEDGLLRFLQHCVKKETGKDGFFVALRELHHFFNSRPIKTFTKDEVQAYLDKAERKVS